MPRLDGAGLVWRQPQRAGGVGQGYQAWQVALGAACQIGDQGVRSGCAGAGGKRGQTIPATRGNHRSPSRWGHRCGRQTRKHAHTHSRKARWQPLRRSEPWRTRKAGAAATKNARKGRFSNDNKRPAATISRPSCWLPLRRWRRSEAPVGHRDQCRLSLLRLPVPAVPRLQPLGCCRPLRHSG